MRSLGPVSSSASATQSKGTDFEVKPLVFTRRAAASDQHALYNIEQYAAYRWIQWAIVWRPVLQQKCRLVHNRQKVKKIIREKRKEIPKTKISQIPKAHTMPCTQDLLYIHVCVRVRLVVMMIEMFCIWFHPACSPAATATTLPHHAESQRRHRVERHSAGQGHLAAQGADAGRAAGG